MRREPDGEGVEIGGIGSQAVRVLTHEGIVGQVRGTAQAEGLGTRIVLGDYLGGAGGVVVGEGDDTRSLSLLAKEGEVSARRKRLGVRPRGHDEEATEVVGVVDGDLGMAAHDAVAREEGSPLVEAERLVATSRKIRIKHAVKREAFDIRHLIDDVTTRENTGSGILEAEGLV